MVFWSGEEEKLKNINIDVTKCETMRSETDNNIQDSHLGNLGHNTLAEIFYKELIINNYRKYGIKIFYKGYS